MKHMTYISLLYLLASLLSTNAIAENHSPLEHKFLLKDQKGFLKYDDPKKGTANARILLEQGTIIMEILTPAYNIHGVETAPDIRTEKEKEQVELETGRFLNNPNRFFAFRPIGVCTMGSITYRLEQDKEVQEQAKLAVTGWRHHDVRAEILFGCKQASPERMVVELFAAFPRLKEIDLQLIANNGDLRRIKLTPDKPVVEFTRSSSD